MKAPEFASLILKEDANYILINKPPFLSTLEDRADPANVALLARQYESQAQVCHRLDKDTSGILAIARNPAAYRHLSMQLEGREVEKIYHAVVDGLHSFDNLLVDAPILKQNDGTVKISSQGKAAQTYFTSIASYRQHTLVQCRPVTGRMHQIRVHLLRLGAPITGDLLYGGKSFLLSSVKRGYKLEKDTEEQPLMRRMALHAFSLKFQNLDGKEIYTEAPYPRDLQALVRQLGRNTR